MRGVILYGPPASGKTSVAEALEQLDRRYVAFRRLKTGQGRRCGYRMTSGETIDALDARGDIIWRNDQYGSTYAVDRPGLLAQLADSLPVVQLGQPEAIAAIEEATPGTQWFVIALHCSRDVAARRIKERGDQDLDERLSVWDGTESLAWADAIVDTGDVSATDVA